MPKSTTTRTRGKTAAPKKPYPTFPLYPHGAGVWAKKIRGRTHYFGSVADDPKGKAALLRFEHEYPYLREGRTPPPVDTGDGCTVRVLCNAFLTAKARQRDSGELTPRSFKDYYATCELLVQHLGGHRRVDDLRPDDFGALRTSMAKEWGPVTLGNTINRCRVILKYAHDNGLIDRPVRYGTAFNRPSARTLRVARQVAGAKLFTRVELHRILDALAGKAVKVEDGDEPLRLTPDPVMRAMVLLGINCGFGNTDVAQLPTATLNLTTSWIDYPRPKTGIARRVPLWPVTVDAMHAAIALRPKPASREYDGLVFLTHQGRPWVRVQPKRKGDDEQRPGGPAAVSIDALTQRFRGYLKVLGISGRRGLGFYTLRHCFETYAGESKDQVAVNAIMGHVDVSMAATYRQGISDDRLRDVVECVRVWLFGKSQSAK